MVYLENDKQILVVITLTELGRDLNGNNLLKKGDEYNAVKGDSWPSFKQILCGIDVDRVTEECFKEGFDIGYDIELYHAIKEYKNLDDFLLKYEAYIFKLIKRFFKFSIVGRGFTRYFNENKHILEEKLLQKSWTDIIAEQGNTKAYPTDVHVVSSVSLNTILEFTYSLPKDQVIKILNSSEQSINWLKDSPYISKITKAHPTEEAHKWWADYLYKSIKWNNNI